MKLVLHKSRVTHGLVLIAILLLLTFIYQQDISRIYAYDGFLFQFDIWKALFTSVIVLLTLLYLMSANFSDLVYGVNIVIFTFVLLPNAILYAFTHDNFMILIGSVFWVVVPALTNFSFLRLKPLFQLSLGQRLKTLTVLVIVLTIPFILVYKVPSSFGALLLQDIYETRAIASEDGNVLVNYALSFLVKILIPTIIIIGLVLKKKLPVLIGTFVTLYIYVSNPHKTLIAFLFVSLFFSRFRDVKSQISFLLRGIVIALIAAVIINQVFDFIILESILARRAFFVPAYLNKVYFDLFSSNHLYLSYSPLNPFMEYTKAYNPSHLVGAYLGNPEEGANNGLIASGYMNFGYFGMFLNLIFYGIYINLLVKNGLSIRFFGLLFIFCVTIISSPFIISLVTHGYFLGLILILFFLNDTKQLLDN